LATALQRSGFHANQRIRTANARWSSSGEQRQATNAGAEPWHVPSDILPGVKPTPSCPACRSRYTVFLQDVVGRRTGQHFPQYVCLECQTFTNPSGYVEDEAQKRHDLKYLIEHQEHIARLQAQLALEILNRATTVRTVAEIGCGSGLFLRACRDLGVLAKGFEVNDLAAEYARDVIGVDVATSMFDATHPHRYDLIAAIGVFEHVADPSGLLATLVTKLNPDGMIYINVPFVDRAQWPYLHTAGTEPASAPPDPFYDNDVHIHHFSHEGLRRMGERSGSRSCESWTSVDVVDRSPGAYPGVLFRY
jgi:hypothetical protein